MNQPANGLDISVQKSSSSTKAKRESYLKDLVIELHGCKIICHHNIVFIDCDE